MGDFIVCLGVMSLQASVLIGVMLILRKLFEKIHISKKYIMPLWLLAFFFLVFPWKIDTPVGVWKNAPLDYQVEEVERLIGEQVMEGEEIKQIENQPEQLVESVANSNQVLENMDKSEMDTKPSKVMDSMREETLPKEESITIDEKDRFTVSQLLFLAGVVWVIGFCGLMTRSLLSYLRLKKKLLASIPEAENVYISDEITVPLVCGLFHPKIYLPSGIGEAYRDYVIAHEQTHISRKDLFVKIVVYLIVNIHWFNPISWIGFKFFVKDMEMACDEETLHRIGEEKNKEYAQALLQLSLGNRMIFQAPLAFCENSIKARIKNVLQNKKSLKIAAVLVIVIGVMITGVFVTKAEEKKKETVEDSGKDSSHQMEINELYEAFIKEIEEASEDGFKSKTTQSLHVTSAFTEENLQLGYFSKDLDSDGVEELLLGVNLTGETESILYGIYTIENNRVVDVAIGNDTSRYYLCKDGKIINKTSVWTEDFSYASYNYLDGKLQFVEALICDKERDKDNPWFYSKKSLGDKNATPFPTGDALEMILGFQYEKVDFTSFKVKNSENLTLLDYWSDIYNFYNLEGLTFTLKDDSNISTVLTVTEGNNSFVGVSVDAVTGAKAEFHGTFTSFKEEDSLVYSATCYALEIDCIEGNMTECYGLSVGDQMVLYMPEISMSAFPDSHKEDVSWSSCVGRGEKLSTYCLYNTTREKGFVIDFADYEGITFADLTKMEFWHGSGAGAWATTMKFRENGSFEGYYSDTDLSGGFGFTSTTRECFFNGKMLELTKVAPYQYSMHCDYLEEEGILEEEKIYGPRLFITTEAYGFEDAEDVILYLPGTLESELPESFLGWANGKAAGGVLLCYGLYNVKTGDGYIVWPYGMDPDQNTRADAEHEKELLAEPNTFEEIDLTEKEFELNNDFTFAKLEGKTFTAKKNAFGCDVTFGSDGTFRGDYGEISFRGKFDSLRQIGPWEYAMTCTEFKTYGVPEKIMIDGITVPQTYGFEHAGEFIIYLPGKSGTQLHEGVGFWNEDLVGGMVDDYRLYSIGGETTFVISKG